MSVQHPRRPSRRTVLAAGVATVAAAGVGVPLGVRFTGRPSGRLVPDLLTADPFYVAHRGGSLDWPEMSMEAYRSAVARGVDALEISLARTADGVWFGLHDETLDRTSGTHAMVAAEHTWADIAPLRIQPSGPHAAGQQPQPYLRFEELVSAYGATHAIFVDPKAAGLAHLPELLSIMDASTPHARTCFVAKAYGPGLAWARLARSRGYRTWGYYYAREVEAGRTPLAGTQSAWDLLGLDVAASPDTWREVLGYGKPVVAHVVTGADEARRSLAVGAHGLMVAGVDEVLGRR